MAQERYYNYGSRIESKKSGEGLALSAGGIGPLIGFNKLSVVDKRLVIDSDCESWFVKKDGTKSNIKHALITPDGILTMEDDTLSFDIDGNEELNYSNGYFLIATHEYIEDSSIESPTRYSLVKMSDTTFFNNSSNLTMSDWITELKKVYPSYSDTSTVILLAIELRNNNTSIFYKYIPYKYIWPIESQIYRNYVTSIEETKGETNFKTDIKVFEDNNHRIVHVELSFSITSEKTSNSELRFKWGSFPNNIIPDGYKWSVLAKVTNAQGDSDSAINKLSKSTFILTNNTGMEGYTNNDICIFDADNPNSGFLIGYYLEGESLKGLTSGTLIFDIPIIL